jgi:FMN phosphatase YigB (HAD superfamily)
MNPNIIASTYDVFDTLLTRRVCDPKAVFQWVGREAARRELTWLSPAAFRAARTEAEALARIGVPDGEVSLARIYAVLARIIGCAKTRIPELMAIELAWEHQMIVPVVGAKAVVAAARQAGRQIYFISEMYLPVEFLADQLREHGFMQTGDKLWVSNTYQASKRSGKLFSVCLRETGLSAGEVEHGGNDWSADVLAPQRVGFQVIHFPQANPTHYEQLLERHSQATNGWASLLAGAGRLVRLQSQANEPMAGLRRIVADVVGPALTCYVLWILQRARSLGLRRLYFVSRDGYVPFLLAKKIAAALVPDLECHYFYGSRQAWHLAGLQVVDEAALEWILGHCDGMNCASLLKRLELTWEECRQFSPKLVAMMGTPEQPVTEALREAFKKALQTDVALLKSIQRKAEEKRALLRDYASQEGLLDDVPRGIVEIGWSGRTRASFEKALADSPLANLHWLYFGIHHRARLQDSDRVHYFLYGPDLLHPEIPFLPVVLESFCLAPHGSVTGYVRAGREVRPCFRAGIEPALENWGRGAVFTAIEEYLQHLPLTCGQFPEVGDLAEAARELLVSFCTKPAAEDAKIWGAIPFEQDQAADKAFPIAPPACLSRANLRNALMYGAVDLGCMGESVGTWGAGSWAARRQPLYLLTLAAWVGYLRIHWKTLPKRSFHQLRKWRLRVKNL